MERTENRGGFIERFVETSAGRVNVASGPQNGSPLLCIHGVGRAWRDYAPLLPEFVPLWSVHCVDLRGHGRSSRTPGRYLVKDYLDDIGALLATMLEPTVIYGHSLGALLAAAAAATWPDRVRGVVLEDPPSADYLARIHSSGYPAVFEAMRRLAGSPKPVGEIAKELADVRIPLADGGTVRLSETRDAAAIRFSARWLKELDGEVYTPVLERRWLEGLDFTSLWPRIASPALLLVGTHSRGGMLPRDDAHSIARQLPDGTLIEFPEVGHQIHWMARETTVRVTLSFLASL